VDEEVKIPNTEFLLPDENPFQKRSHEKNTTHLLFGIASTLAMAQPGTYLISQQGTVNSCAGDFFDSGGNGGSYGSNENFVMTFNSTNPTNTHIRMSFNSFDVDASDTLIVYDGSTTASPLIGKYNNSNLPPAFVKASIYNVSGI
jgi:hypothetical protein